MLLGVAVSLQCHPIPQNQKKTTGQSILLEKRTIISLTRVYCSDLVNTVILLSGYNSGKKKEDSETLKVITIFILYLSEH